jgi:UDP-galactopyranose mutase
MELKLPPNIHDPKLIQTCDHLQQYLQEAVKLSKEIHEELVMHEDLSFGKLGERSRQTAIAAHEYTRKVWMASLHTLPDSITARIFLPDKSYLLEDMYPEFYQQLTFIRGERSISGERLKKNHETFPVKLVKSRTKHDNDKKLPKLYYCPSCQLISSLYPCVKCGSKLPEISHDTTSSHSMVEMNI